MLRRGAHPKWASSGTTGFTSSQPLPHKQRDMQLPWGLMVSRHWEAGFQTTLNSCEPQVRSAWCSAWALIPHWEVCSSSSPGKGSTPGKNILHLEHNCAPQHIRAGEGGRGPTCLPLLWLCSCCWVASVVSDSVRPHRRQPTKLPRPWDSPGKNTGVGCHCLLQCMNVKVKVKSLSRVRLCDPMGCSLPGSSVHGISRQEHWSGVPLPSPCDCKFSLLPQGLFLRRCGGHGGIHLEVWGRAGGSSQGPRLALQRVTSWFP